MPMTDAELRAWRIANGRLTPAPDDDAVTTPERCGAAHQLDAPAIHGRAVIFECERTPGHLGSHRETVGEFAGVWATVAEQEPTP